MRQSGRDKAYAYLKSVLLSDPTMAGRFISEQDVAEAVNVSRTPVREALLVLAAEDLVQLVPHRGAFVAPLTAGEIREILQARELVERWAVVETLAGDRAPVTAMADRLARQESLLDGPPEDFIALDREFHTALVEAAGNALISKMYEALRARHVVVGVRALEHDGGRRRDVLSEHRAIVDALAAHDQVRAEQAVSHHLAATRRMLVHEI